MVDCSHERYVLISKSFFFEVVISIIFPITGVVKFHQVAINEECENNGTMNISSDELQPPSSIISFLI